MLATHKVEQFTLRDTHKKPSVGDYRRRSPLTAMKNTLGLLAISSLEVVKESLLNFQWHIDLSNLVTYNPPNDIKPGHLREYKCHDIFLAAYVAFAVHSTILTSA